MDDGVSLVVGGGAVGALAGIVGAWIKARYGKTKVDPTPLPVEKSQTQALLEANESDHKNLFLRMGNLEQRVSNIEGQMPHILACINRIERKVDELPRRMRP